MKPHVYLRRRQHRRRARRPFGPLGQWREVDLRDVDDVRNLGLERIEALGVVVRTESLGDATRREL